MSLIDLLKEEQGLVSQMLEALKRENKALINDDISSLNEAVKAFERLNNSVLKIEQERINSFGGSNITDIILRLQREGKFEEAHEIEIIGRDMREKTNNIEQLNQNNDLLIRQSLSYVRSMINILSPEENKLYSPSGEISSEAPSKNVLDISI